MATYLYISVPVSEPVHQTYTQVMISFKNGDSQLKKHKMIMTKAEEAYLLLLLTVTITVLVLFHFTMTHQSTKDSSRGSK